MLVLIGIIILAISFIIALVSLIREEKHRESLAEEAEVDSDLIGVDKQVVDAPEEKEPEPLPPVSPPTTAVDVMHTAKSDTVPVNGADNVFPWEENNPGDANDKEEEPLPLSEARYPHLGESKTLVGEIKISDLSKKEQ